MIRLLLSAAMVPILVGCGENITARGSPDSPSPNIKENPGLVAANPIGTQAQSFPDPEARNGLVKEMLGRRAFTLRDSGSPPPGNAGQVIRSLEAAARSGSGKASYEIHLKIRECLHVLKAADRGGVPSIRPELHENCKGLSSEDQAAGADWLRLAAEQGHLGAQKLFASDAESVIGGIQDMFRDPEAVQEYKRDAIGYMSAASKRGFIDALRWMGDMHSYGVYSAQDRVKGYAYYLAVQRAAPEHISDRMLAQISAGFSSEEVERATTISKEIHDECCG